ncbi:hypothetical protein C900_05280 [Fulvivirga imtechensis AK7]|uniref:histidine kinase n=1 Tax=Fulvivirga imtechensis AK7 TaxID=1237149 RepID=L8JNX7_9BACT|nr:tetratricopeptide repeat protein [Fulvivirga imtechensis]ELR69209.1 hypothetical protein C900_05280 [Fulvivirga imtechensis AK7]
MWTPFRITLYVCALLHVGTLVGQNRSIDSLNAILAQDTHDSIKVNALNALSQLLVYSDTERAIDLSDRAIHLSKISDLQAHQQLSTITRALLHYQLSELDSSKYYCDIAIEFAKANNMKIDLGKCYNLLGSIYLDLGNYGLALQTYTQALKIFKEVPFPSGIGASLNRIGAFYTKRGEHETALKYYREALEIFEKVNRFDQITVALNNIGICYFKRKEYEEALNYFMSSLDMLKVHGPEEQIPIRIMNIGETHAKLKNFRQADKYLTQVVTYAEKNSHPKLLSSALLYLGILRKEQIRRSEAYEYLEQGLKLASAHSLKDLELEYYQNLSSLHAEQADYHKAYNYYLKFSLLKDSLSSIEQNRELLLMEQRFEAEQSEQKIALLQHEAEKKNIILYSLIAGTALLIISFILIFINYKNKQKTIRLIHRQKEKISRQKITDLLKDQELSSIKNKLEGQENERKRIAQELHDGIGGTMASIKMNLLKLSNNETPFKDQILDIIKRIDNTCEEVRTISHNLVPPVFYNSALTDIIEDFVNKMIKARSISVTYEFYPKRQLENINKNIQIDIYRIVQELVTNAIKHGNPSEISIYLTKHDDYINLMVEDNGTGFANNRPADGIGLKNIRSRVLALSGQIVIDSIPGKGTTVIIDLLLKKDKSQLQPQAHIPENSDI